MKSKLEWIVFIFALMVFFTISAVGLFIWFSGTVETAWRPFIFDPPSYPATNSLEEGFYLDRVQPIFNRRCIACHGCLDSPCGLKMTSYEGLLRGGIAKNPNQPHLFAEQPIRLHDAPSLAAWRERGFCTVIDQTSPPLQRPSRSVLYRLITTGIEHNGPGFDLKPLEPIYKNSDDHLCPCGDRMDAYLLKRPTAGMPFGLPGLTQQQHGLFSRWSVAGAPGPTDAEMKKKLASAYPEVVRRWEAFFNRDDPRAPLVSRYLYEHSFLATLIFAEAPGEFYKLIRSTSPPGVTPIRRIVTARPFDSPYLPGVQKVYYRLQKVTSSYVQKSFFVFKLSDASRGRLEELFYQSRWPQGGDLTPGYRSHNPFEVFAAIPAKSRSLFLLENSELIANGMIRGPVCVGNIATYAIKDYFWVFFVDPDSDPSVKSPKLGLKSWHDFTSFDLVENASYEKAYANTLNSYKPDGYTIEDIWNGGGTNPNAWLTILRNETNATVMQGRKGGIPPTFWLIDYSGYERLYYSLVANYQYWGGEEKKIATWEFMGFLRQEFEDNFLRLLPLSERSLYRDKWTSGLGRDLLFTMPFPDEGSKNAVEIINRDPISNVLGLIQKHLTAKVSGAKDLLNSPPPHEVSLAEPIQNTADWVRSVRSLSMKTGQSFTQYLPSVTFLRLNVEDRWEVYTLIANRSYAFNNVIFDENGARQPKLDTLSVYEGLVGDFPNLLVSLSVDDAAEFLSSLKRVESLDTWRRWKEKYGTLRNDRGFWPLLDWFTDWNFAHQSPEAGYYDLRYYNLLDSNN